MEDNKNIVQKKIVVGLTVMLLLIITLFSIYTKFWVLTAFPVGFLFGFFLQKGDLCGSSAFSEIIMMKDYSKIFGLWLVIVISMIGFALLDLFGLVSLNPKPFLYVNYIVGGIIFGAGTVLAGGCVSGCLYKAAEGNLNSMAALIAIPIGIALVEFGPLSNIQASMKKLVLNTSGGEKLTLSSITHLPFWLFALLFAVITLFLILRKKKFGKALNKNNSKTGPLFYRIFLKRWKPWQAGIAIGILAILAYMSSASSGRNYPLGVTHGVLHTELLVIDKNFQHVWDKPSPVNTSRSIGEVTNEPKQQPQQTQGKKIVWWLVLLVISLFAGSFISAKISGQAKLLPKPPEQTLIAFFGGILVGSGAAIATGCVIGNIMSGWALMSIGLFVFGLFTILSNWGITYLYLMGGLKKSDK